MENHLRKLSVELDTSPAVEARELYRFYHSGDDETFALRGVSIAVQAGEMVAIVGPSGSGKSTLLSCIAGLDEPDGGFVAIAGRRLTRRSEAARSELRAGRIGMLMQSGNLLEHLTVEQNVRAAHSLARRSGTGQPIDVLASVGIAHRASSSPSSLSGGEAARAGLAVALANDPPVLLADEPTGELDAASEETILGLLRRRAAGGGAVVVVSHSPRVAAASHRVIQLTDGRIVA